MKDYFFKAILLLSGLIVSTFSYSQIVGQEAFMQGNFVEIGVSSCGAYGTVAPAPAGYNPNAPMGQLGFIADGDQDGWNAGNPPFCGDYFVPGDPEEGFSIEIAGQNFGNFQNNCGTNQIPGAITGFTNAGGVTTVTWTGNINGLQVVQVTTLNPNDLFFTTNVTLTNTTNATMNSVFYMRNVDPDNEQPWTGNFNTQNSIAFQTPAACPRALATAVGPTSGCFLGLGTIDQRARATFGGFTNRSASAIWNGTGFSQTGSNTADQAISLSFNIGDIPAGGSEVLAYAYILSAADLENVLPLPPLPPVTANSIDISVTNLFEGCVNEPVNINIADGGNFTWTWSPMTEITSVTNNGSSVVIQPTSSRVYTASGVNDCGQEVVREITVNVSTKPNANAGADRMICPGTSTTIGTGYTWPHEYSWTSVPVGFTSTASNPSVSPAETTVYTLTESNNGCTDTDEVTVSIINTEMTGPDEVCMHGTGYVYSVAAIPGATYNWWLEGSGSIVAGQGTNQVTVNFPWFTGGTLVVGINVSGSYCEARLPITVAPGVITVTPATAEVCPDEPVTLTASGATSYSWSPATGLNQTTGASVEATVQSTTTYTVTGTNIHGCAASGQATVTIKPESECCLIPLVTKCSGNTYSYTSKFDAYNSQGVAIDNSNTIYVSNYTSGGIDKFTSTGAYIESLSPGLNLPLGLAVDNGGNLFVADHNNRRIAKVSPAGALLCGVQPLNTVGEAMMPVHVTVDNCGFVYATVTHGSWIYKYDNNCNFIEHIETALPGETGLTKHITGVAVDNLGNVFVADNTYATMKKFDKDGNFISSWPIDNVAETAVDAGGNIYAVDQPNKRVVKYSNTGTVLATFDRAPEGDEFQWLPFGIDVDGDCNVWVSNNRNVTKFSYTSTAPKIGADLGSVNATESFVNAFPNPSSGKITVDFVKAGTYEIVVYSSLGIEVLRETVNGQTFEVQDHQLLPGVYTIHTSGNGIDKTLSVIKTE